MKHFYRLSSLPIEAQNIIFNQLVFFERLKCTQVYRFVADNKLKWPHLFSEITNVSFDEGYYFNISQLFISYYMHINRSYVRKLPLIFRAKEISTKDKNDELSLIMDSWKISLSNVNPNYYSSSENVSSYASSEKETFEPEMLTTLGRNELRISCAHNVGALSELDNFLDKAPIVQNHTLKTLIVSCGEDSRIRKDTHVHIILDKLARHFIQNNSQPYAGWPQGNQQQPNQTNQTVSTNRARIMQQLYNNSQAAMAAAQATRESTHNNMNGNQTPNNTGGLY
ncbi:hypothetical protein BDA99DRAFT_543478 [Phascolomyces articulosus]|uniref:F-box domain-containing protein n=1 Tax=Phascolomyces articulosus TaxID=60185 RepID=A0AAD5P7M2_9FUNG|nr:hypothetical protein BDA99DRAFT_543478 [Phascolomyces articulosus]